MLPLLLLLVVVPLLHLSEGAHTDQIPRGCKPPLDWFPFCNASLPLDERLDDIISRLTLQEKPYLLVARESPKGNISRLGIPEFDWGGNCMHGVQSRCAPDGRCPTSFPNPNSLGPTFNRTIWKTMGTAIGLELRALWLQNVGENHDDRNLPHMGLDCWSPNLNIVRDPRWGRNLETPSEDPFLVGVFGTLYTLGLQNNSQVDDRYFQAVATLKHLDANSLEGPHWTPDGKWDKKHGNITRYSVNAKISMHDWAASYLAAFRQAVVEGGAAGIMCSYNRINGVPACAHEYLLQRVVRQQWKFRGYVTSDSHALEKIVTTHHYAKDWPETVQLALQAGCDIESAAWTKGNMFATGGHYIDEVPSAVQSGLIDEELVDRALRNALGVRFRLGLFDPIEDQPFWNIPPSTVQQPDHVKLAKEATAQGLVLLKNDNKIVPIDPTKYSIALIGPHLYDNITMAGNYLGQLCPKDNPSCVTTFHAGFVEAVSKYQGKGLGAAKGCSVNGNDKTGFAEAIDVAKKADVVIYVGGNNLHMEAEFIDRPDIRLPAIQVELLQEIAKVNDKIVTVLLHGGMIGLDAIVNQAAAVISAGYPGRYAGEILPDVLFGKNARAWGKLAITWYHDSIQEDLNMLDFSMSRPPGRTYRYFQGTPQYPFGHGLNPLTSFDLSKLVVHKGKGKQTLALQTNVTNTGSRPGSEIVMAFFSPPSTLSKRQPASKLRKQLFGFERVHLQPTVSRTVAFEISPTVFQLYDSDGLQVLFPGKYSVTVTNGVDAEEQISILIDKQHNLKVLHGPDESATQ
ncbi:xylosidase/alpha-L-arabinofuranosidase 1 [Seminavis robusta]|uniref:Xylosidase/alpha-L-arabinofuranosidase 1 n=1 Tax=Seminavis robusta TaxID=568900 RepID=A0A9N8DAT1_9STRA|nr:xylosidase/alpha-L-arabinofuranosidase 1 [Seminavis robusta]|eukprot:Sro14_g010450.1 xylosidase/alpha-L-arabinofuranosidase 1 (796) ;mRNA; f:50630-53017